MYGASQKTQCLYCDNVPRARWQKLVYNATWNPICAMTRLDSGTLRCIEGMVENLVRPAMAEVVKTAKALGHELPSDVIETMINTDPIELHAKPSMLVDVEKVSMGASSHRSPESAWASRTGVESRTARPLLTASCNFPSTDFEDWLGELHRIRKLGRSTSPGGTGGQCSNTSLADPL